MGRADSMPRSRWRAIRALEADQRYLVLASSIPTKKVTSAWRMFKGARQVRGQLEGTEGVIGFSLLARPLRNQYATLSVWVDEAALATFVATKPHAEIMGRLSSDMAAPKFERWFIDGAGKRPSWREALRRLG